jgi:hypothetical protein
MRFLILTAGYGEGHNAAARGLQAAFASLGEESEIVDLFAVTGGDFYERSRRGYLELINRAPRVWALAFQFIDCIPFVQFSERSGVWLSHRGDRFDYDQFRLVSLRQRQLHRVE